MIKLLPLIFIFFISSCNNGEINSDREPYIGTVNGYYMDLSIYMLYLEEQINIFESEIGTYIWSTNLDGISTVTLAKSHALQNMALSILIRDLASSHEIYISEEPLTDIQFFEESIRIREELRGILTEAYAEDQRVEIFGNMEDNWLLSAEIIRNIEIWDEITIGE